MHLTRPKTEPQIGEAFPQRFVVVLVQIDDGNVASRLQHTMGFGKHVGRSGNMVQDHAGDDTVHFAISDRQVLQIAKAKIAARNSDASRFPGQFEHRH